MKSPDMPILIVTWNPNRSTERVRTEVLVCVIAFFQSED